MADFGLARAGAAGLQTLTGQGMGTPGYMAPEQEENAKNATAASDQFSLAATLYHLVTGSSPRRLNFRRVPTELVEVLERALDEDPANRYPNILAFRDALGDAVRKSGPAAVKPNAPKPTVDGNDLAELLRATQQRIDRGHEEAQRLFNACQDEAVLKTLAEIPEHLRDKKLETEANQRWNRTRELERLISESVRQMKTAGVKGLVEELLQLYPHRADMRKLLQQLPPEPKVVTPELLIAPFSAEVAKRAQEDWARRLGKPVEFTNRVGMELR